MAVIVGRHVFRPILIVLWGVRGRNCCRNYGDSWRLNATGVMRGGCRPINQATLPRSTVPTFADETDAIDLTRGSDIDDVFEKTRTFITSCRVL